MACIDGRDTRGQDVKLHYRPSDEQPQRRRGTFANLLDHSSAELESGHVAAISNKYNQMYLLGEVDAKGRIVNQFQQVNITVVAMTDHCTGHIECARESLEAGD